jgi:malate dehydrogenase (oxaloacetate-decarboxylating)(NADP+)
MEWEDKLLTPGQGKLTTRLFLFCSLNVRLTTEPGNNMYVFPGIGLGAILSKAVSITQDMIYASAESLSTSLNKQEVADGWLYPDIRRIREVSVVVTRGVIRAAQKNGVDRATELRNLDDTQLDAFIKEHMYDPFSERENAGDEVNKLISGVNGHSISNGANGANAHL